MRVLEEKREAIGGYDDWKRRHHGQSAKKSNHKKKKENVVPNSLVFARHRSTLCALLFVTRLQSLCCFLLLLLRFTSRICAAPSLIICRINLSRVRWRRDAFPLEKRRRCICQKMNFFTRRARARRDTCVFPVFKREKKRSIISRWGRCCLG